LANDEPPQHRAGDGVMEHRGIGKPNAIIRADFCVKGSPVEHVEFLR